MPELAEIKIMSEYINNVCMFEDFTSIGVSEEVSKRLGIVQPTDLQVFTISAKSRGKELALILTSGLHEYRLSVAMGMSGYWALTTRDDIPKHTHLKFNSVSGNSLCLVDARRFARWKWATGWSQNRGPCPVEEKLQFRHNIFNSIHKAAFNAPIHLILMNQLYFNGIGNYLRAEILFRADQDPFEPARSALYNNPKILDLCSEVPYEAYLIGGGQLKDWENPFDVPKDGFRGWIQCYGKPEANSIVDKNGRTLWYFEPKKKTNLTV